MAHFQIEHKSSFSLVKRNEGFLFVHKNLAYTQRQLFFLLEKLFSRTAMFEFNFEFQFNYFPVSHLVMFNQES